MDFDEAKHLIEEFFNGKFEVKKFLGEGSFAKVYLVKHNYLDNLMAMKIVKEPLSLKTDKKSVFREVTLASQLRHENIISIYDAAVISNFGDGLDHAYFVMEYVSGGDLELFLNSFIENNLFMPIGRVLDLISQILSGLNTLHSANPPIVHRDLKPNNVLLSFNSRGDIIIKISDFGFAKQVTTSISDIDIAGTRPYMAPELFNKDVSTRSDVYAVGVIFYQLLTNRYPYDVDKYSTEELINLKPWKKDLNPPSHYNCEVSAEMDEIVMKCLSINPLNRYDDAGDLLADIEKAIDNYRSGRVVSADNIDDYEDEYSEYIINDSLKEAFRLAKHENKLSQAIEILEQEVVMDYDVRKCYSETLRIWKSKRPDLKMISKAFTVNLKGRNYKLSCNFLKEAIAYNPSIQQKYQHYIDLWEIFIDLESHGSLFKSVVLLENLMDSNFEIKKIYKPLLATLKTYSIDEIVAGAIRLVHMNELTAGANLMEFAVVCDSAVREKYAYKMSLWKQNMKMHFKQLRKHHKNTVDYAIDLGTTDSVISYYNDGNPIIIKNHRTGEDFTPSAVMIDENDDVKVGVQARNAILESSRNAVGQFKHNMGFSIPFKFENSSRVMYPEELSAEVLKDLRVSVFNESGVNIDHAVICVPANSNPIKTRAVRDAAELAGFRSYSLILEPIAVSLAYGLSKENGIWMIYDMGGGTFNVTLVRDNHGEIEKLANDGLENLGGNAFDWEIVNDLFRPKIAHDLNLDDFRRDNPKYLNIFARLKNAAEKIKKDLSESNSTYICIHNLFDNYDFTYDLSRDEFSEIIEPLVKYSFKICNNLLKDNSLKLENIEKIILVGGSCLSPVVRKFIMDEFACDVEYSLNPLTVVSVGAAIYAGSIKKPKISLKDDDFSVILKPSDGKISGMAFTSDDKFSFLGHYIEFKGDGKSTRIPLNIDGTFNARLEFNEYDINLYRGDVKLKLDLKSPDFITNDEIRIPYLEDNFSLNDYSKSLAETGRQYFELLKDISYLKGYSYDFEGVDYLERLVEIAKSFDGAIAQAMIYIEHYKKLTSDANDDLEFKLLLENVENKMRIVNDYDMFEVGSFDEIKNSGDLQKLNDFHSLLIEKYTSINAEEVMRDCFTNLKFEGIYSSNEGFSRELIEKGELALNLNDFDDLLEIVNLLYELDERW
ncbi:Hsp70 family protein [Methanobrevibacter sp.]|uniref:Hsp70 family protein n=1 Tax=Methanobrevibacter sp. TaxID=66852 RepID=UPI00388FCC02